MEFRYRKISVIIKSLMILMAFGAILMFVNWKSEVDSGFSGSETPEYMEVSIMTDMTYEEDGPILTSEKESYAAIAVQFYDTSDGGREKITDQNIVDAILTGFKVEDEKFIISQEKSKDGMVYFYYNGIVSKNNNPILFSGYYGNNSVMESTGVTSFEIVSAEAFTPAENFDDITEAIESLNVYIR